MKQYVDLEGFTIVDPNSREPHLIEMFRERREVKSSTCGSRSGYEIGDPLYEAVMSESFYDAHGSYVRGHQLDEDGYRIDDRTNEELETACLEFLPNDTIEWRRGWAKLYDQNDKIIAAFGGGEGEG